VGGEQRARVHHLSEHALPDAGQSTPQSGTIFERWQVVIEKCRAQESMPAFVVGEAAWLFGPQATFNRAELGAKPQMRIVEGRVVNQLLAREAGRRGAADSDFVVVLER
jgi:hypothetical protein